MTAYNLARSAAADSSALDTSSRLFSSISRKIPGFFEKSDQLRKMRDQAKKQAEASCQLEVIEKAKRQAAVVNILDENKNMIKQITAKHYRGMSFFQKERMSRVCMRKS